MFSDQIDQLDSNNIQNLICNEDSSIVTPILEKDTISYEDCLLLLSPGAKKVLPEMVQKAKSITQRQFGKVMQIYIPIYLSNECINGCSYCGFNIKSDIKRETLTMESFEKECQIIKEKGFDNILLLTGESEKRVPVSYISEAIILAKKYFTYVALEIYPLSNEGYSELVNAGANGITLYQETYDSAIYKDVHGVGPKSDYAWRLNAPDRALSSKMSKMGIGVLLGLSSWRMDVALLAAHATYLSKKYWRSELSLSFPRIRSAEGGLKRLYSVDDEAMVQMITALRIYLPWVGLTLSTRESPQLRDVLVDFGITQISAESKTNPGGYSGEDSHQQFSISDHRTLLEVVNMLHEKGYDPVIKDWAHEFR
jgi:2-iminoacetate synthase